MASTGCRSLQGRISGCRPKGFAITTFDLEGDASLAQNSADTMQPYSIGQVEDDRTQTTALAPSSLGHHRQVAALDGEPCTCVERLDDLGDLVIEVQLLKDRLLLLDEVDDAFDERRGNAKASDDLVSLSLIALLPAHHELADGFIESLLEIHEQDEGRPAHQLA